MSDALLPYPREWLEFLTPFIDCFTKPQYGNFCQYTTSMVVSQHRSVLRRAALFTPKHQSSLNDFLTESPWDERKVHDRLTRLTLRRVPDARVGIIDDTFSHKPYAKKMIGLGWFYDGLTKETQWGHSIVTHGVHSNELGFVPLEVQWHTKNGRSKNDRACEMIRRTQRYRHMSFWTVDSWYSNRQVLGTIRRTGAHYVTEIKSNRNVTISQHRRFVREHERLIREQDWRTEKIKDDTYRYFQTRAFINGLGTVNLVFSQRRENKEWGETYFLITDLLTLPAGRVIVLFLLRGGIEGFHRETKQQLGLERYQLRRDRGIARYLFLIVLVYALLLLLNQHRMRLIDERRTVGELREYVRAACFTTLLHEARHCSSEHLAATAQRLAYAL